MIVERLYAICFSCPATWPYFILPGVRRMKCSCGALLPKNPAKW